MIATVHAAAHIAISLIPINWNLPISFGIFRKAERAVEQANLRPVTAQDLECSSPSKEHRRRGKSYPDKAVSHGPIYNRCDEFLEKALQSAPTGSIAHPFVAETQKDISSSAVNSPPLYTKETCEEQTGAGCTVTADIAKTDIVEAAQKNELPAISIILSSDNTTLAEPEETSVSIESNSLSMHEAVMDYGVTCSNESEMGTVFYSDETSSSCSTPAASPWGSLEPEPYICKVSTEASIQDNSKSDLADIPNTMSADQTTLDEPAETSISNESNSSSSDEMTYIDDSESDNAFFYIDETSSSSSTPAASPWGSLEPEASICEDSAEASIQADATESEVNQVSAPEVQSTAPRTDLSINRKENGELDLIGKGTFGSVYKGSYRGMKVAIKLTGVPTFRKETEGQVFARIGNHKNVISLHTFYRDGFGIDKLETLVLDYAPADLSKMVNIIASNPCRDYIAFVTDCLADALTHIHKRGYAHMDVSPRNVLLMRDGVPKLADFSSSLKWKSGDKPLEVYPVGTVGFRAPEIIAHLGYDTSADWFSLGALIFYMINARLPWERDDAAQMEFIRNGKPGLEDALPESFCDFVSDLLSDAPDLRITEDLTFLSDETEF